MTRETRIGLLVGLGFIVMFGIVLSEITATTPQNGPTTALSQPVSVEPARAPVLAQIQARNDNAANLAATGNDPRAVDRPIPTLETAPAVIRAELARPPIAAETGIVTSLVRPTVEEPAIPVVVRPADVEEPVAIAPTPVVPAPARRTYVIEAGDTLTRIARKVYGPEGAREYKRIYEANRGVLPSESALTVGKELVIPDLPGRAAATPAAAVAAVPAVPTVVRPTASVRELGLEELRSTLGAEPVRTDRARTYVVQRGDNLAKIAKKVLRDDSRGAIQKLYSANKELLEHPDRLTVGTELKIPT